MGMERFHRVELWLIGKAAINVRLMYQKHYYIWFQSHGLGKLLKSQHFAIRSECIHWDSKILGTIVYKTYCADHIQYIGTKITKRTYDMLS